MKPLTSLIAMVLTTGPVFAGDIGLSVEYGEPGFYGRLDIGSAPRPVLINPEPIIVIPAERIGPPIYMRVPPGHAKRWKDHCAAYGACGRPVYFVRDGWYNDVYVPHYRKHHPGKGKGKGKHGNGHKG